MEPLTTVARLLLYIIKDHTDGSGTDDPCFAPTGQAPASWWMAKTGEPFHNVLVGLGELHAHGVISVDVDEGMVRLCWKGGAP